MSMACIASACAMALLAAGPALSQIAPPPEKVAPPENVMPKPGHGLGQMPVRNLVGAKVYNQDGERIGTVDGVVVSQATKVLAAVIGQLEWRGDRVVASGFSRELMP